MEDPQVKKAFNEWTECWKTIAEVLVIVGDKSSEQNAKAILARLSHAGYVIVKSDEIT